MRFRAQGLGYDLGRDEESEGWDEVYLHSGPRAARSAYRRRADAPIDSGPARRDRRWSMPFLFIGIIGTGFLFAFYDVFDINVSFIQSCVALKPGCTPAQRGDRPAGPRGAQSRRLRDRG